jgi:hypothetical protein
MLSRWSAATGMLLVAAAFEGIYPAYTDDRLIEIGPDYTPLAIAALLTVATVLVGIAGYLRWYAQNTFTQAKPSQDWFSSVRLAVRFAYVTLRDGVNPLKTDQELDELRRKV